jgi:hypothetical protein
MMDVTYNELRTLTLIGFRVDSVAIDITILLNAVFIYMLYQFFTAKNLKGACVYQIYVLVWIQSMLQTWM